MNRVEEEVRGGSNLPKGNGEGLGGLGSGYQALG